MKDKDQKVKQGALEYNAYLIKNLLDKVESSDSETQGALHLLYSNLVKLARNLDLHQKKSLKRHKLAALAKDLETDEAIEFFKEYKNQEVRISTDAIRLNQLAKLCSNSQD